MVLIFSEYDAVVFATNGAVNFGKPEWVDQSEWERNGLRACNRICSPHCAKYFITH